MLVANIKIEKPLKYQRRLGLGLSKWVDSALGRFGRSLYQNVDCLGQADKQVDR